tara:strand:- start:145 stop:456 length:312 start_codon:yes stop_codon:yes gene_type:complete
VERAEEEEEEDSIVPNGRLRLRSRPVVAVDVVVVGKLLELDPDDDEEENVEEEESAFRLLRNDTSGSGTDSIDSNDVTFCCNLANRARRLSRVDMFNFKLQHL